MPAGWTGVAYLSYLGQSHGTMLSRWEAMRLVATVTVVALGMVVTSTFSWLMRETRPGANPFDAATLALAAGALYLLVTARAGGSRSASSR